MNGFSNTRSINTRSHCLRKPQQTAMEPSLMDSNHQTSHLSEKLNMLNNHSINSASHITPASVPATCWNWNFIPAMEEEASREHLYLLNKIGCACMQQKKQEDAKTSFASALLELKKYAPLVLERLVSNLSQVNAMLKNLGNHMACDDENDLPNRSLYIYQRENYDEGMYMYQNALPITARQSSVQMEATLLYNLGQAHIQTFQYNQAKNWFELALLVAQEQPQDCCTTTVDGAISYLIRHNLGNCCYRLGDNDASLVHYKAALDTVLCTGHRLEDLAASYNCVAVLQFHKSHPSEPSDTALEYLQIALNSYTSILGGDCSKEVATVMSNIGRVFFLRADYKKALELFQRALAIRQMVLPADSVDIATAMFNVGQTHHRCGNLDHATTYYRGFLEVAQVQLGTEHRDFAAGLVLLSDVHRERQEFPAAQVLLEQAIQCGRAALGESHPDLALIFNNLGSLSYELRKYEDALRYYLKCVEIQSEFLDQNHPHIVISLLNVAQIHKQKGDYHTAFTVYREVYNIHYETHGAESMEVATTISSMALMKYLVKDYQVSLYFYLEALRLHRARTDSNKDMDVAATLNSIGLVRFKMDDLDSAKDAFLECLNIRKHLLGADHRDIAVMWYNLATIYLEKGEGQIAMKLYGESLRVERRALGEKHPEISLTLQHLGQMHQERGELETAVEYFKEALEIERLALAGDTDASKRETTDASICKLLNLIGNIHLMCGRVEEMMTCFLEACEFGGHKGDALIIAGHNFYGLSRVHPPCAPLA